MGHVGLTPQSISRLGSYKVQGTMPDDAGKLLAAARDLQSAGVFSMVLESVPMEVAEVITDAVSVPTIGIGAGPHCDGQVLVFHDMMGISTGYMPRFVKKYADLGLVINRAVAEYSEDVRSGKFPDDANSYHLKPEAGQAVCERLRDLAGGRKKE